MDEEIKDGLEGKKDQPRESSCASADDKYKLAYCVTDAPPWYLCIVLSIQVCVWRSCEFLVVVGVSGKLQSLYGIV